MRATQCLAALPVLPDVFLDWPPLPLAIGAGKDLAALQPVGFRGRARAAIRCWCRSRDYRRQLARPGAWRHDLDGKPLAPVSDDHRSLARQQLRQQRKRRPSDPTPTRRPHKARP